MSTTPADATGALPARPATTAVPIHPLLSARWSTRRFDPDARLDDANGKPNPTRQHDTGLSAMSLVVEAGAMSARGGWHARLEEDA